MDLNPDRLGSSSEKKPLSQNDFMCVIIVTRELNYSVLGQVGLELWFPWQHIAWLAGFIKRTTTHCYMQNMKAFGLVVSEKLFYVFPMTPPGRGLYGPHGHGWQNFIKRAFIQMLRTK